MIPWWKYACGHTCSRMHVCYVHDLITCMHAVITPSALRPAICVHACLPVQVSHETGKTMKMVVPSHGIWGTAGIDGMNIDPAIKVA